MPFGFGILYLNNYATYGTYIGTNGATQFIPVGQAFFVKAGGAATRSASQQQCQGSQWTGSFLMIQTKDSSE